MFVVPYALLGVFLGPEYPTLIGGLIALALTVTAAKLGFFQPKRTWDFPPETEWDPEWKSDLPPQPEVEGVARIPMWKAWLPYVLVGVLLMVMHLQAQVWNFVKNDAKIGFTNLFDTAADGPAAAKTAINALSAPLALPGTVFIIVVLICIPLHRMRWPAVRAALGEAGRALYGAAVAIIFAVPMVRIFIESNINDAGLKSMPSQLAGTVSDLTGRAWPALSALIGAIGAFVAGSNTISNMTFSLFQFEVALDIGLAPLGPLFVVALQAVGGAAGNMICVHNVVAASATVGLFGKEGSLIRKTLIPTIYYLVAAGLIGCFVLLVLQSG